MQWGPRFTYTSPTLPAGSYHITFTFQEIPGGAVTGPGQRVFTVGWLGQTFSPIDLWKMTGGTTPVQITGKFDVSFPGPVVFTFSALVRNAVVSAIDITQDSIQGILFVSRGEDIISHFPCPIGWTGPTLTDGGGCIAIFFSQSQNNPGQTSPALVQ